jgi:hypothetical protein
MTDSPFNRDNVGWNTWNMSKRLSSAKQFARSAREYVVELEESKMTPPDVLETAKALLACLEDDAAQADDTWEKIRLVVSSGDPTLIDPPEGGVSCIHNHGSSPALMESVWAVWAEDHSVSDAYAHFEQLKILIGKNKASTQVQLTQVPPKTSGPFK